MAPVQSWTNPLAGLAILTDHPARLSEELSSALSDPNEFETARQRATNLIQEYRPVSPRDDTAAVLRIFLAKLPNEGQTALISDIITSKDHAGLRTLRDHLVDAILKPMKLAGGKQPITAPTNPVALEQIDLSMTEIEPSQREQGKIKRECLKREGFRCSISGHYDTSSVNEGKVILPPAERATATQCAHILPFALREFDANSALETKNKAIIWWSLHRYFPELRGKIDAGSINQHGNLITIDNSIHFSFGNYSIGFWPMDMENTYEIRSFSASGLPAVIPTGQRYFRLESHDRQIPLPNKDFLKVHCRIAEILQLARREAMIPGI
ncbi:hypothetical protein V8C42DRAFT_325949 [Trichoderma barbatum]